MDIDFLVRNMRRPVPEVQVAAEARGKGYLVESDRITDVTKLYSTEGLEIEFLIGKVGAGLEASLRTNLGVTAQSLRHMEVLARHMVTVPYEGMAVNIPAPEAYVVHKMVVNKERGKKQEKDAQAILRMWPSLTQGCSVKSSPGSPGRSARGSPRSWRRTGCAYLDPLDFG
jgi:hypothetical protein